MRVDRDRLIVLALAVLERAREEIRAGPIKPGPDVRLALAVLFGLDRSGERDCYDRFWRNLGAEFPASFSDADARIRRMNEAHACFETIARGVGAPADPEYRSRISKLVRPEPTASGGVSPQNAPPPTPHPQ